MDSLVKACLEAKRLGLSGHAAVQYARLVREQPDKALVDAVEEFADGEGHEFLNSGGQL